LLEQQLEASLIEFDGQLLREQEALQASEAARAGAEAASEGGAFGSETSPDQGMDTGASGAGSETSAHTSSGGGNLPDAQPTREGGTSQGEQQQGPRVRRTDIPDGDDDDIVARQLREAAERETDPALKEKLWDEYRKYKQGSRG
jgi:hypothetical protein